VCDVFYRRILPGRSESVDHLNYLPNDMKPSCPPGAQPHRSKNLHGTHVGAAPPDSAFTSTFITKPQSATKSRAYQPEFYQPATTETPSLTLCDVCAET
jgi:hypothetical protein